MKKLGLIAIVAMLTACGGGGGGSTTASTATDTATASIATATALGATTVANPSGYSASAVSYKVAADIGDTWVETFDPATGIYLVHMEKTQYGLADATGTFTSSTSGNFTTYTLGTGGTGSFVVDNRTKGISGISTIGGKTTTVSGTGYRISDLAKLAGTYFFTYATRNQSNGGSTDTAAGQLVINSAGTSATMCSGGTVNANNTCTPFAAGVTTELNTFTLAMSGDSVVLTNSGAEWGRLHVHAGDFGASLIVDRYGLNASNILRVGTLYAAKAQTFKGTEFDGNWSCSQLGKADSTATVSGTSATVKDASTPNATGTATYTITYNQIVDRNNNNQKIAFNGIANMTTTAAGFTSAVNVLPLSSSLTITSNAYGGLNVCRKTS